MSIATFSKDHGRAIVGTGLLSLAFSLAYVGHGIFSRFDRIEALTEKAQQTVENTKEVVADVEGVQISMKQDLIDLRAQFPSFAVETGENAAGAVQAFAEVLNRDENQPGSVGERVRQGLIDRLKGADGQKPPQP